MRDDAAARRVDAVENAARHGHAAFRAIVRRIEQSLLDQFNHRFLQGRLFLKLKLGRVSPQRAQQFLGVFRGAELALCIGNIARLPGSQ